MAKPIRATPELKGGDARHFLDEMKEAEESRITKKEIELAKAILSISL